MCTGRHKWSSKQQMLIICVELLLFDDVVPLEFATKHICVFFLILIYCMASPPLAGEKGCIVPMMILPKMQLSQQHQMGAYWATEMVFHWYLQKYKPKSHRNCCDKSSSCSRKGVHCSFGWKWRYFQKCNRRSGIKWEPTGSPRWYFTDISKNISWKATEIAVASPPLAGVKDELASMYAWIVKSDNDDIIPVFVIIRNKILWWRYTEMTWLNAQVYGSTR